MTAARLNPVSDEAEDLYERVLQLPEADQRALARRLVRHLRPDDGVEQAWYDEAEARLARFRAGESKSTPWSAVRDELFNH